MQDIQMEHWSKNVYTNADVLCQTTSLQRKMMEHLNLREASNLMDQEAYSACSGTYPELNMKKYQP